MAHDRGVPLRVFVDETRPRSPGAARQRRAVLCRRAEPDLDRAISDGLDDGRFARVAVTPPGAEAINPAFDEAPAELIDGFVADRGIVAAEAAALARAFGRTPNSA